jgi:predicted nucleic acid-binding protein
MITALIDTNLLVYFFDPRDPVRQNRAGEVLHFLEETKTGYLSVQNLAEFMSVCSRRLTPWITLSEGMQQTELWMIAYPALELTPLIVLEAARGVRDYSMAYYDAQIWATARLNQIPYILSEDFQDGMVLEGVTFINPFSPHFDLSRWLGT